MSYTKIIFILTFFGLSALLSAPAWALDGFSKEPSHSHKGYSKPGAAVALSYDYDGKTQIGEHEDITLTLDHHYSSGDISARLLETEGLDILSYSILDNESLSLGSALSLPIQVSSTQAGEYFISLEVIYESLSGAHSLRVLSLPVQIGGSNISKRLSDTAPAAKTKGQKGIVILNAYETIK